MIKRKKTMDHLGSWQVTLTMKTTKGKQQEGVIYFFVHAQIKQTVIVRKDQSDHLLLVTLEQ